MSRRPSDLAARLLAMHQASGFDALLALTIETLEAHIECDWASVSYAPARPGAPRRFWSAMQREQERVCSPAVEFAREHPMWLAWWSSLADEPTDMTRVVDEGELHSTDIYNTVLRPLHIRRMIGQCMPGGIDFAVGVIRDRPVEFSDEDLRIVHLVSKHLTLSLERLVERRGGRFDVRGEVERLHRHAYIRLTPEGRILAATPEAGALLGCDLRLGLPQDVLAWLMQGAGQPLVRARSSRAEVLISAIAPRLPGDGKGLHLMVVPCGDGRPRSVPALTQREREVSRWLAAGKSNAEIGMILGISAATAKKHVERILRKAGVENRTAFAALVLDGR
ncbi:MAG: hypothetical protein KF866_10150 [Phycisphaeraceae bacterium]|nr:hypothetical protein [Phycisphaeraceae bacterium]MCW5754862.1 hypothetical protein [Phycisphaeraceae bacterium]